MNLRPSRRPAFTMIELLVVMGIIIALASLALLITPRFAEDQRTTRGADLIQGWLLSQKQRAYRDQLPRGIRLVVDPTDLSTGLVHVREMIYIERPEDLRGDPDPNVPDTIAANPNNPNNTNHNHLQVPIPFGQFANNNSFVFIPNWDLQTNDLVLPGDFLKINTYESQPYNIHRIAAITFPFMSRSSRGQPVRGTRLQLAAADGTPSTVLPGGRIALEADTRFQIIRQSRPMSGEPNLQLPRDVIVDLDPTTAGTSVLPSNPTLVAGQTPNPADGLDIMFSQRGQTMGNNANSGKIILRVRNVDKLPDSALSTAAGSLVYDTGEQLFIVIHTRTGLITAHPFNNDLTGNKDWYQFTRDAKDSGM